MTFTPGLACFGTLGCGRMGRLSLPLLSDGLTQMERMNRADWPILRVELKTQRVLCCFLLSAVKVSYILYIYLVSSLVHEQRMCVSTGQWRQIVRFEVKSNRSIENDAEIQALILQQVRL